MSQILNSTDGANNSGDAQWSDGGGVISGNSTWKLPVQVSTLGLGDVSLSPAPPAIDGEALVTGSRVLLTDQAAPAENGVYEFDGADLIRPSDYDATSLVEAGTKVYVQEGATNAKKTLRLAAPTTPLTVDTTATTWENDSGGGGGGGEDLAATLVLGNVTGAAGTAGLPIKGPAAVAASGNNGNALVLQGGDGDGAGLVGPIQASTTGNTRGGGAVDLQQSAALPTQVASAPNSALIGGSNNRIDAGINNSESGIFSGRSNTITGDYAFTSAIVGGFYNTIDGGTTYGPYSTVIAGGRNNSAGTYSYGSLLCGEYNTVEGAVPGYFAANCFSGGTNNAVRGQVGYGGVYDSFAFGRNNVNEGDTSAAFGRFNSVYASTAFVGGNSTTVNGIGSFAWAIDGGSHPRSNYAQAFGHSSYTYCVGQSSWSSARLGAWNPGEGQRAAYGLFRETTDATPTELTTTSSTLDADSRLSIRAGRTYMCRILVSARQIAGLAGTVGDSATWEVQAAIKRDLANNTVLVGVPTGTGAPLFNNAGAAAWTVAVTADDANESLAITVTGELNKTIRWSANVLTSEVGSNT